MWKWMQNEWKYKWCLCQKKLKISSLVITIYMLHKGNVLQYVQKWEQYFSGVWTVNKLINTCKLMQPFPNIIGRALPLMLHLQHHTIHTTHTNVPVHENKIIIFAASEGPPFQLDYFTGDLQHETVGLNLRYTQVPC